MLRRTVDIAVLIVLVPVAVGFATWFAARLAALQSLRRAMQAIPRQRIADVDDGEVVRVVGTVREKRTVLAPLSGRPCAYFRVVVEERVLGNNLNVWGGLVDEEGGVDFLLEDASGRALVEVSHAKAVLEGDASGESGFLSEPSAELEPFLQARGHSLRSFVFDRPIRYREWVVESGDVVAVVGTGRWEHDPSEPARAGDGYRDAVKPRRLVLAAPPGGPLLLAEESDVTT